MSTTGSGAYTTGDLASAVEASVSPAWASPSTGVRALFTPRQIAFAASTAHNTVAGWL